ncbi:MAG: YqhA family protein [Candidatus Melainabacteria bacterium]|nr:YqhA family protein [Candidatus Melainabacteria bacterium]
MQNLTVAIIISTVSILVVMPLALGIFLELAKRRDQEDSTGRSQNAPQMVNTPNTMDFGQVLLYSRWLLTPFYLGMVLTAGIYLYKFVRKLAQLVGEVDVLSDKELMLRVLYLVDIVMVANLLMYTAIGSFAYFVRQFHFKNSQEQAGMLGHLDATTLKMKLGMALIGVSSIHLLEAFMDSVN